MPTKTEILKVRIPPDMLNKLQKLAEQKDEPVSQIVRELLAQKLSEQAAKKRRATDKAEEPIRPQ